MPVRLCTFSALEPKLVHKHVARRGCVLWGCDLANQRTVSAPDGKVFFFTCVEAKHERLVQNMDLDSWHRFINMFQDKLLILGEKIENKHIVKENTRTHVFLEI